MRHSFPSFALVPGHCTYNGPVLLIQVKPTKRSVYCKPINCAHPRAFALTYMRVSHMFALLHARVLKRANQYDKVRCSFGVILNPLLAEKCKALQQHRSNARALQQHRSNARLREGILKTKGTMRLSRTLGAGRARFSTDTPHKTCTEVATPRRQSARFEQMNIIIIIITIFNVMTKILEELVNVWPIIFGRKVQ